MCAVDVRIYRPVVARPKRTGKQGKPVNRYTGENARTCTRKADVSPQTSIWRVCVSPAVVVAYNYSIISARVCNTAVHRRQQFSYDSSALSAQAGEHSIGTVPKTWFADAVDFLVVIRILRMGRSRRIPGW